MRLDRTSPDGDGKYLLVKQRAVRALGGKPAAAVAEALDVLRTFGVLDESPSGSEGEFFVIRLRDRFSAVALYSYAAAASAKDAEYGADVMELAARAGPHSKFCKTPD